MPRFEYYPPEEIDRALLIEGKGVQIEGIGTYCAVTGKLLRLRTETEVLAPIDPARPYARRDVVRVDEHEIDLIALSIVLGDYTRWQRLEAHQLADLVEADRERTLWGGSNGAYQEAAE